LIGSFNLHGFVVLAFPELGVCTDGEVLIIVYNKLEEICFFGHHKQIHTALQFFDAGKGEHAFFIHGCRIAQVFIVEVIIGDIGGVARF